MYKPITKTNQPKPVFNLLPSMRLLNLSPIKIPAMASAVTLNNKVQSIVLLPRSPVNPIKDLAVFERELTYLEQVNCHDISFAVASPKKVHKEYRCVFVDGKVVGHSLYMIDGEPCQNEKTPQNLINGVQAWYDSQNFLPRHVVVDITDTGKIIEINSLLTSGWYACDLERIIGSIFEVYNGILR